MKKSNNFLRINRLYFIIVAFLFGIICLKLVYVSSSSKVDGIDLKKFALSRTTATKVINASRGTIYDSLGDILAQDVRSYTVIAYLDSSRTKNEKKPQHVVDKELTAKSLSPIINMSEKSILNLLSNDKLYQVELGPGGRGITELVKQKIESLELPGIDFIKSSKRDYPNGDFASYIVGYAKKNDNEEMIGELGIESKYDEELKGINGKITYQKDAYGYKIANTPEVVEEAKPGNDIYLTIDSNIQLYLESAVAKLKEIGFDWATITVADANTGAIVGSASGPSFNPNTLNIQNWNSPLTSYIYEPGSTMKIYSFMAAIEEGIYDGLKKYDSGNIVVDNYKISDWNTKGWGKITYDTGFAYSSNVAAVLLAQKLGNDKLLSYYEKFGFGEKTDIELSNEYNGKVDFYYNSELASAAFGQGITTTPIQNIAALTTLTNKGILLKPYIIDKIVNSETKEVIYEGKRTEVRKAVSENTVNKMLELLDSVVNSEDTNVTGKKYQTDRVRLIGKTGTAEYTNEFGRYSSGTYNNIRSFAGIFPKDDPKYIIYLSVKRLTGVSNKMGSIVKEVVESISKYKNLNTRESDADTQKIKVLNNYINNKVKEAKDSLIGVDLNPIIIGDGNKIIKQYPSKGISVLKGSKVFLLTNGNNYLMPDVINYTDNEIVSLMKLIGATYNIEGYGNVKEISVNKDELIDVSLPINIVLGG